MIGISLKIAERSIGVSMAATGRNIVRMRQNVGLTVKDLQAVLTFDPSTGTITM